MFENHMVSILSAQGRIAIGRFHLKDATRDFQDRNVEGPASEIVHSHSMTFFFLHTKCQSCSGRLVNDPQYLKASNSPSILRCLTLGVVEVGGNCHDSLAYIASQI
mmetsp:Transcript_29779/g.79162  ORF Transcript_29779/g.79162 Transcript_29779/m.79162 type:complete len:106 (+) Transcript_29779:1394-1711(+)